MFPGEEEGGGAFILWGKHWVCFYFWHSGGQIQTFPGYHNHQNIPQAEKFDRSIFFFLKFYNSDDIRLYFTLSRKSDSGQ